MSDNYHLTQTNRLVHPNNHHKTLILTNREAKIQAKSHRNMLAKNGSC